MSDKYSNADSSGEEHIDKTTTNRGSRRFEIKKITLSAQADKIGKKIDSDFNSLKEIYSLYDALSESSAEGFRKEYYQIVRYARYYRTCIDNNVQKEIFLKLYEGCAEDLEKRKEKLWEDIYKQEMNKTKIAYQILAKNIGDKGYSLSERRERYDYLDYVYSETIEIMICIKGKKDKKAWDDFISGSGLYREDDLGAQEGMNPDQSRNSMELPDPSDHSQESRHLISNGNSYLRGEFKKEMPSQNWDNLLEKQKDKQLHEQDGYWTEDEIRNMREEAAQQVKRWKDTLWPKLQNLPAFQGFPRDELERLFIDGRYQKEGSNYTFPDEPSFMPGLMRAFDMMLQGLGTRKLTAEYFEQLHDECVRNTYKEIYSHPIHEKRSEYEFELGYRTEISYPGKVLMFGWTDDKWSKEGIRELDEKYYCRQGGEKRDPDYGEKGHPVGNVCMHKPSMMMWEEGSYAVCRLTRDDCLETATRIIDQYYKEQEHICQKLASDHQELEWSPDLVKCLSPEEVKELQRPIARLDGNLEQSHLFPDGNMRVIAFIIDRKLELELGLYPSILYDVSIYDGKSVQEVVDAKYKGQQVFKAIREGGSVKELLNEEEDVSEPWRLMQPD